MDNWKAKKNKNHYDQKKKEFVPNRNFKNKFLSEQYYEERAK